jgi:hypothetical protein
MPKIPEKGKPSVLTFTDPDASEALSPMHFRVPAKFRRDFKLFAIQHDMSMVELLRRSFELMKSQTKR